MIVQLATAARYSLISALLVALLVLARGRATRLRPAQNAGDRP